MSEIHSLAWRVIVWLGEDSAGLAMTAVETINWFVKDCCSTIGMEFVEIDLSSGSESDENIRDVKQPPQRDLVNIYSRAGGIFE
jgi:hypothetical protein